MSIKVEDINLLTFLEKVAPASFPDAGKLTLTDTDFLTIAALLKLDMSINNLRSKLK